MVYFYVSALKNDNSLELYKEVLEHNVDLEKKLNDGAPVAKIGVDAADNEPRKDTERWTI